MLIKGSTTSCGCVKFETKHPEGKLFAKRYSGYKSNAKRRNIEFSLTEEDFRNLINSPCYFTGRTLTWESMGIDRLDSSRGYTLDNCVPACFPVNRAKSDMSVTEFFELIRNVVATHPEVLVVKG